jgi:hypothetical protein
MLAPVRHLVLLLRNMMAAVPVQLGRQGGHPGIRGDRPAAPVRVRRHQADLCNKVPRGLTRSTQKSVEERRGCWRRHSRQRWLPPQAAQRFPASRPPGSNVRPLARLPRMERCRSRISFPQTTSSST